MNARRPLMALTLTLVQLLAGCTARRPPVVADVPPPPVEVAAGPALPMGASPGMLVPEALADGSFPTPNQGLTGAAAIWHLRAGLNVAALSCPGIEGATIRTGYNRWLTHEKAPLGRTARAYAATYRVKVGAGRYDDAMTRLYNFYSQTPVRASFCAAAAGVAADLATLPAAALPAFAAERLAALDQPFVDFYRAYDAWRGGSRSRAVIASVAVTPVAGAPAAAAPIAIAMTAPTRTTATRPGAVPPQRATLTLDLSSLPADAAVTAH